MFAPSYKNSKQPNHLIHSQERYTGKRSRAIERDRQCEKERQTQVSVVTTNKSHCQSGDTSKALGFQIPCRRKYKGLKGKECGEPVLNS